MRRRLFTPEAESIERPLRIPAPPAYSLYTDAWKEFDRLDKFVHNRGIFSHLRVVFDSLVFGGAGLFGITIGKHYKGDIVAVWVVIVGLELALFAYMKNHFKHWECPRCHAEWPGTSKEKGPSCKMCGLRLHQLTP
jgi:hypothetical protein